MNVYINRATRTAGFAAWLLVIISFQASAQGRLVLNGAKVNIANGATVVIANSNANAIKRNSGHIISEGQNNVLQWNIGTTTGSYTVPWGYGNTEYIPVTFTKAAGTGSGVFKFSTYHTTWNNSSQLPTGVTNLNGVTGGDMSSYTVDRFWQVNASGYTTKPALSNVVFSYASNEYDAPNDVTLESRLTAERWNPSASSWTDYTSGGTVNAPANTVTVPSVDAANLYPWWTMAYPGANLHWISSNHGPWNNKNNWSTVAGGPGGAGVPTAADAVYFEGNAVSNCAINTVAKAYSINIASGYTGTITQSSQTITITNQATFSGGNFQGGTADITVGGPLTISGGAFFAPLTTLDLKGNLVVSSGSFAANNGTVKFSGTNGQQTISGAKVNNFANINVTNTSGLSIESSQNLQGVLTLASNVTVDADGSNNNAIFTLLSSGDSPTKDAAIGILPSGARVDGNVTVQRYMAIEGPSKTRIYRYIASPLQAATVSDIQKEIPVTGTFTGTSKCSGCTTSASMFSYNEKVITDTNKTGVADSDDGYENFPVASNTEILTPGRGYAMFVRGNLISSALWDVRGTINAGNVTPVSLPVTFTSSGTIANDGWNLVGNPFPSTIDWDATSGWTKANLDAAIYIRDNGSANTQVAAWNGVVGTNGGSSRIAMGQGFWVKANGNGTPVLKAAENIKVAGTQTTFFKKAAPTDVLRITMVSGAVRDEAVIHFRADATEKFDTQADALKLPNTAFNLSSLMADGKVLAINSLPAFSCNSTVKLNVANAAAGSYTLDFSDYESFPASVNIMLTDNFTNNTVNVRETKSYSFAVTSKQESYGSNRFAVTFSYPAVSSAFIASAKDICSGINAIVQVQNTQADIAYTAQVKNTTITSAAVTGTGNSINLTIPKAGLSAGADTILIKAAGNGCSPDVVKTMVLNVGQRPEIASVTGGKQCTQGHVTLQAAGAPDNGSYRWYESLTATTPVASAQNATYTTPVINQSKTYYVSAVSAMGCEGTRQPVLAEIVTLQHATITEHGDSLSSNYTSGNQWYFNGAAIANGNTQSIKLQNHSGIYRVDVSVDGCTTSAERELIVAGIEHGAATVSLYPNPVVKELHIEVPGHYTNVTAVRLMNAAGQEVGTLELQQESGKRTGILDMKNYPAGVYILQSTDAATTIEAKIMKN